ncbi:MAG: MBL fold metallo-hydrolase [Eubacteriales bacterium]|nr:MBL fold metallo-hydrolase [Eubacteriales bacterium]
MNWELTFIGHSGVLCRGGDAALLFDYFTGKLPTRAFEQADRGWVFVSHAHADHYQERIRALPHARFVFSQDVDAPADAHLAPGQLWQDGDVTVRAFGSTDAGVSFLVALPGLSLFHAGDLNLWSWKDESTPKEIAQATQDFHRALEPLRGIPVDIACFPWDRRMGTDYDEGLLEYVQAVSPRYLLPIHFTSGFAELAAYAAAHPLAHTRWLLPAQNGSTFTLTL